MKSLFGKRVLCITKDKNTLHMIELGSDAKASQVHNYVKIDALPEDSQEASKELRQTLLDHDFVANTIYASVQLDQLKYKRLTVPIMNTLELRSVVKREVEKMMELPLQDLYFDYKIVHICFEKGYKRYTVLIGASPREEMAAFENLLRQAKLTPDYITGITFGLQATPARKRKALEQLENEVDVYVFLSDNVSHVVFMQQGWIVFSREFYINRNEHGEEIPESSANLSNVKELSTQERFRLITELSRSIQYFQQSFRDYLIQKVFFCGKVIDTEPIKAALSREQKLDFADYMEVSALNTEALKEREEAFLKVLPEYAPAIGLNQGVPFKEKLNFVPVPSFIQKWRVLVFGTLSLLILMALGIFFFIFQKQSEMELELPLLQNKVKQIETRLNHLQDVDARRKRFKKLEDIVSREVFQDSRFTSYGLKELTRRIPPQAQLTEMSLEYKKDGWEGKLLGVVRTSRAEEARQIFEKFYLSLQDSPFFSDWKSEPLEIQDRNKQLRLNFHLKFKMKTFPEFQDESQ